MANRVADYQVKEIIDTSLTTTDPFIETANIIVTEKLSGQGLSVSHLAQIEKWLAAHFVATREPSIKSEKIGEAAATYFGKDGMGLESTRYGQQVLVLDTTGILANMGKKKANFEVIDN